MMRKSITLQFVNKFDKMAYSMRDILEFAKKNKRILGKDFEINYIINTLEQFQKDLYLKH